MKIDSYLFDLLVCLQPCAIPCSSNGSSGDASSENDSTGLESAGHGFWSVEHHMIRCQRREKILGQEMKSENFQVETSLWRSSQCHFHIHRSFRPSL